jgi:hypothetical protein
MPVIPSTKEFKRQIATAMADRAPQLHARLTREGLLEQELDNRVKVAREAHAEASSETLFQIFSAPDPDPLVHASRINQATQASWEAASALAFEFPDESHSGSSDPET